MCLCSTINKRERDAKYMGSTRGQSTSNNNNMVPDGIYIYEKHVQTNQRTAPSRLVQVELWQVNIYT